MSWSTEKLLIALLVVAALVILGLTYAKRPHPVCGPGEILVRAASGYDACAVGHE